MLDRHRVSGLTFLHQIPRDLERLFETNSLIAVLSGFADDVVCAPSHVTLLRPVDVDPEMVQRRLRMDARHRLRVGESLEHMIHLGRGLCESDGWGLPRPCMSVLQPQRVEEL